MSITDEFSAPEGDYKLKTQLFPYNRDAASPRMPASLPHTVTVHLKSCAEGNDEFSGIHLIFNHLRYVYWHKDYAPHPVDTLSHSRGVYVVTCHDIHQMKQDDASIQALIGFTTGELVYREMISQKSTAFNIDGAFLKQPVSVVRWMPGENAFLCGFADGTLFLMSIERSGTNEIGPVGSARKAAGATSTSFTAIHNKVATSNPVAMWTFGTETGTIHDVAFSPDGESAAIVCAAGTLYVVDVKHEKLVFSASSYFGALYCVAWSPDGLYVATGGQDDLVTIWSVKDHDIVARAQGHSSWVTAVAFDPHLKTGEQCYRFGSVAQDTRLCLWDFSVASLRQPRRSSSVGAHMSPVAQTRRKKKKNKEASDVPQHITARPRSDVATLAPTVCVALHDEPLSALVFQDSAIVTACTSGTVRLWSRPPVHTAV